MLGNAGIGVAMDKAHQLVKEIADIITETNDEKGIIQIINLFLSSNSQLSIIHYSFDMDGTWYAVFG